MSKSLVLSETTYKVCSIYRQNLSVDQFYAQQRFYRSGFRTQIKSACKECSRQRDRQRHRANKNRDKLLQQRYNISQEEYNELYKAQDGLCLICRKGNFSFRDGELVVDHNHKTKQVRGLLCSSCNSGLGYFGDNLILLKRAVLYLKTFQEM